ncbi:helix-turn-helix domain-containing protein [Roseivirga sp.]|uniref:AraC family transcriptional regulator n=1 Tax=Roseivirga sp. TaxID=1964215 RepID=UPI003B527475
MDNGIPYYLSLVNLLGAFEGFFLAFHFFTKKQSHRFLTFNIGLLLTAFSIFLLNTFFILSGIALPFDWMQLLANASLLLIGPSLYLYISFHRNTQLSFEKAYYHYLPALFVLCLEPFFVDSVIERVVMVMAFLGIGVYIILSIRLILNFAEDNPPYFSWLKPVFYTFMGVFALNILTKAFGSQLGIPSYIQLNITLFFLIPILWIAIKEMRQDKEQQVFRKKYTYATISSEKANDYLKRIEKSMEEDLLFRNPELTVKELSAILNIPAKTISQLVNEYHQKSFKDYVNGFRIEDVKKQLLRPENNAFTILAIAEQSGFKSGGRFNTLFKEATGLTPTQYKRDHSG